MPDYPKTVEKLSAEIRDKIGVVFHGAHELPRQREIVRRQAEDFLIELVGEALTEQDAELARLRAEVERWRKNAIDEARCPCTDHYIAPYCPVHGG